MSNEINTSLVAQWQNVCRKIMDESSDTVLNGWLSEITPQMTSEGEVCLSVPTRFMQEWIQAKSYDRLICSLWQNENPQLEKVLIRTKTPVTDLPEPTVEVLPTEAPVITELPQQGEPEYPKVTFSGTC